MADGKDKNLNIIEQELCFISRHAQNVETHDHDYIDEICMAVNSALRALTEHKLSLQPACEEIPADVPLAA